MPDRTKFLGMSKGQARGVVITLAVAAAFLMAVCAFEIYNLAVQGAQTSQAVCTLRHDLTVREQSSKTFLALTPKQRVRKYGKALGAIPPAVIQQSLTGQEATIKSLSSLDCG